MSKDPSCVSGQRLRYSIMVAGFGEVDVLPVVMPTSGLMVRLLKLIISP